MLNIWILSNDQAGEHSAAFQGLFEFCADALMFFKGTRNPMGILACVDQGIIIQGADVRKMAKCGRIGGVGSISMVAPFKNSIIILGWS